ncbi:MULTISPECIES: hypothetical protein [unclassified Limnohabitans]|uniref:hypothetical protein n=1 Tax=unclassified Limnohabitans TaxID=2626134 RepID=UPI00105708A9|nr:MULTISPECIES: hypothetical protein [unclassified Limnohabitans]
MSFLTLGQTGLRSMRPKAISSGFDAKQLSARLKSSVFGQQALRVPVICHLNQGFLTQTCHNWRLKSGQSTANRLLIRILLNLKQELKC